MSAVTLPYPCLALITDSSLRPGTTLLDAVDGAAKAGGVDLVQLREKEMPQAALLRLALDLRDITKGRNLFIVNGPFAVAAAAGADGIHLPEDGPSIEEARRFFGQDAIIGRSVHSLEGALRAEVAGANYVQLGSIFPTRSHPGVTPQGLDVLHETASRLRIPVLAIGGITAANVGSVLAAGAAGCAVISAILSAPDPRAAAGQLKAAMAGAAAEAR
ncbi:MAG TPA: thiamine phosphate synthase [Dehalococcoidia bacterium]|nr:thiamine phosphate synthase [Dehalococcoidia bacterium]